MRNAILLLAYSIFCVIFLIGITQAQNSLTHDTGTLEVTIVENGYIGDNASVTYGGVVFNGNPNAMFCAGLIFGQDELGYGNFGVGLLEDFYNDIPIAGFYSTPNFNQYAYYTVALFGNPDSKTMVESLSDANQDFVFFRANISNDVVNIDSLYPGIFADWDVGTFSSNRGGYVPSKNLFYVYQMGGANDSSFYGIMGIAINGVPMVPNTMKGSIIDRPSGISTDSIRTLAYHYMTSTAFDTITTNGDKIMFVSVGPHSFQPGQTLVVDIAIVAGTSLADILVNAQAAIDYGPFIPVELTSFTATALTGKVIINWTTATEVNNLGFEIERKIILSESDGEWITIGFKEGYGTTTEPREYSYVDDISNITSTSLSYRLKQIDLDGSYEYSEEVLVDNTALLDYALQQNYPNPFNPSTTIKYSVPELSFVTIKIYDVLGSEVATLINEEKSIGSYEVEFNASILPSGVYFYRLQAGSFIETKKMVLLR